MRPIHSMRVSEPTSCLRGGTKAATFKKTVRFEVEEKLAKVRFFPLIESERECLVPAFAYEWEAIWVRDQVNDYKRKEMTVHPSSEDNTAFLGVLTREDRRNACWKKIYQICF